MRLRAVVLCVVLVLTSACARAGGGASAPSIDVTGSWAGTWATDDQRLSGDCRLSLRQDNTSVAGVLLMTGVLPVQPSGYIDGTVTGDQFSFSRGPVTASLKVVGNTMRGPISGLSSPAIVNLYRIGK
jgi:hypothetical protein